MVWSCEAEFFTRCDSAYELFSVLKGISLCLDDIGTLVASSDVSTLLLCQVNQDVTHHAKNGERQTRSTTTRCCSDIPSALQFCMRSTLIDTQLRLHVLHDLIARWSRGSICI